MIVHYIIAVHFISHAQTLLWFIKYFCLNQSVNVNSSNFKTKWNISNNCKNNRNNKTKTKLAIPPAHREHTDAPAAEKEPGGQLTQVKAGFVR